MLADCSQLHHFTGFEIYGASVDFRLPKAIQIYGPEAGVPFLPNFLRFDQVNIELTAVKSIEKICELFVTQLAPLKAALSVSCVILSCPVIQSPSCSGDQTLLLSFLRNQFLPLFDTSRRYDFRFFLPFDAIRPIGWETDADVEAVVTNFISRIFELLQIIHCRDVRIYLYPSATYPQVRIRLRLPVDLILNWLNRKSDGKSADEQQERNLQIGLSYRIQNAQELCDHIKKVCFYIFFTFHS